jgi:hypothetical protein
VKASGPEYDVEAFPACAFERRLLVEHSLDGNPLPLERARDGSRMSGVSRAIVCAAFSARRAAQHSAERS